MKGSFAGAAATASLCRPHKQYAVDFNADGHINLWDPVDAIGSVANYFKQQRLVSRDLVAVQALPGQAPGLENGFKTKYSVSQLAAAGLTPTQPLGNHQQASLLRLDVGTGYEYRCTTRTSTPSPATTTAPTLRYVWRWVWRLRRPRGGY
ncbi:lytic murein transglycosylase [Klebsiella pneumoniae]|nr:lytic murein transglycosylase [Klebsiella pneumoniae]